ncbi:hypothetical protein CH063_08340 [Colletotrichum higginsianum]|uniref:Uncharacterized protein n=2 Tax=Colletotrichum higginsianum TaxID=80884 RepID=H1V9H1_COLHI|nr:hypothetical protein CH63R_06144 [Colletotrichum higginsianum IMI 349063]OBR10452.1 hypothetical protein CH63R_06144 [Colletotrichum higginsianum IMI 349063]TID06866.1 hypothetical protein CH35J_001030 [Colletotrichum higginsianum]CCF36874.1 hypothetical protein CH063_08340 [Colletotrichum higginsianum]
MSPTATVGMASATTKALSLTTPFVEPGKCYMPLNLAAFTTNVSGAATRELALVAGPDNADFAYCQPPGWEGDSMSSILAFSPAVCPSNWPMHHVAAHETVVSGTSTKTVTTAYCCDMRQTVYPTGVSGLGIEFFSSNPACVSTLPSNHSRTFYGQPDGTTGAYATFTEGTVVRPAWRISWEATDRKSLSPVPPSLTAGQSLSFWTPTPKDSGKSCTAEDPCQDLQIGGLIPMIAVPSSVGFVLIVGIIICCVVAKKRKRKRKEAALSADAVLVDDQK